MLEYFRCEPDVLCENTACCRSPVTQPAIGLGDLYRLNQATNKPIVDIWNEHGDMMVKKTDLIPGGLFVASMALFHDPCPYLDNSQCGVYSSRPKNCMYFPYDVFSDDPHLDTPQLDGFRCLENSRFSDANRRFYRGVREVMIDEREHDNKYFWSDGHPFMLILSEPIYRRYVLNAIRKQRQRTNKSDTHSKRLVGSIQQTNRFFRDGKSPLTHPSEFARLLQPVAFATYQGVIADKLRQVTPETLGFYERTTQRLRSLQATKDLVTLSA